MVKNSKWITIALNAILLYKTDTCFVFVFMDHFYCIYFSCICFTLKVFCLYVYISTVYTDHVLWISNLLWTLNRFVAFYCAICIIMVVNVNWICFIVIYFYHYSACQQSKINMWEKWLPFVKLHPISLTLSSQCIHKLNPRSVRWSKNLKSYHNNFHFKYSCVSQREKYDKCKSFHMQ